MAQSVSRRIKRHGNVPIVSSTKLTKFGRLLSTVYRKKLYTLKTAKPLKR
jgi:hypothetical protein